MDPGDPLSTPAAILLGLEALARRFDPILEHAATDVSDEVLLADDHALVAILLGWMSFRRTVSSRLAALPDPPPLPSTPARAGWLR